MSGQDARTTVVAICGGGLIGTSIAIGLLRHGGYELRVHDADVAVRATLATLLMPAGEWATVVDTWEEAARDADVLVAAVPPPAVAGILARGALVADTAALLTDVAGIKGRVVSEVLEALRPIADAAERYVGGHPMAGSERNGPGAADADLFTGATWVLTPTGRTSDIALTSVGRIVGELGGRVLVLDAEAHDTIVGLVSHLPQLVASVLTDVAAETVGAERDAVLAVAGPGFRDTTRIAASDPALWLDIVDGNREAVLRALDAFSARLEQVVVAVRAEDREGLRDVLDRASRARRRLVPKQLDAVLVDLVVPLQDRPGSIARITHALGSAGINIEDLAMRHASASDRGSLLVRILADDLEAARHALRTADVQGADVEDARS
jgi:prephenate dehydrogenase